MANVDIPVWLFVVITAGAPALGVLVTLVATRRSRRAARKVHRQMRETLTSTQAELDDAVATARRELTRANELRLERDTHAAELERLRGSLEDLRLQLDRERDRVNTLTGELATFRSRFTDIVGLESEMAILRVIAARVPALEERIAELESDSTATDLRHGARNVAE